METNIGIPGILFVLSIFLFVLLPIFLGAIFMGMQKKVKLTHSDSGLNKYGYFGYCWTYYIFGFFVPIFRGEIGIGLLHLVFSIFTFGIFQLVMPFLYNKQYTSRMLTSGWRLSDEETVNALARKKLKISEFQSVAFLN